jgi:hypothetical protein
MRNWKKYLYTTIGALALIGVGTLLSPRRSEAQFSSPVRVMNTSAAPALNSRIDDPGRIPLIATFSNGCSGNSCFYTFPAVSAGHRVVIQSVSGNLVFNSAPTVLAGFVTSTAGTGSVQFNVPVAPAGTVTSFDQPVLYFVDAGQSPEVQFFSTGAQFNSTVGQNLTLVGYELDCNAAPCSAIATH